MRLDGGKLELQEFGEKTVATYCISHRESVINRALGLTLLFKLYKFT